jgi:hypothetical protein
MTRLWILGLALCAGMAEAKDEAKCPKGLICASDPETVVKGLQSAGYKAQLSKDAYGDPYIASSSSGYNFAVFFYGCADHAQCDSLQFNVVFERDGRETTELANKWNADKRYVNLAIDPNGRFHAEYDVPTIGGLNTTHFGALTTAWEMTLGELRQFFLKNRKQGE